MTTNLMGELMTARFNELHAEADRRRTVSAARAVQRAQRGKRAGSPRHGRPRWALAHR